MKDEATKKWTCSDGKTRNAGQGPWVDREDVQQFLAFCNENGHVTRTHPDPFTEAHQVLHKGHWMGLIWNKAWKRFTADRRLSLLVQSFAARVIELEALAEQREVKDVVIDNMGDPFIVKAYVTPQPAQRTRQGLKGDELRSILGGDHTQISLALTIEAKLKEKHGL